MGSQSKTNSAEIGANMHSDSAGAYPIMDVNMSSVEIDVALSQTWIDGVALNGSWTGTFDGAIRLILIG